MGDRSSIQYIVVNSSDCHFWQMVAAKWMGQFVELSASIYPEAWCSYWQNYEYFYAEECKHPSGLDPQVDEPHAETQVIPAPVSSNLHMQEPEEHHISERSDEVVEPQHDGEASLGTVTPSTDDFDDALLEHSMEILATRDGDPELQVDWNMCGPGTINLVDMGVDEAGCFPHGPPAANLGVLINSRHAARRPVRAPPLSAADSGRDFCCASDFDSDFVQHHAPIVSGEVAFELGQPVQLHGLKDARYNQMHGKIHTSSAVDGRRGVRLACGKLISVKISNLRPAPLTGGKEHGDDGLTWSVPELGQCKLWSNSGDSFCGPDGGRAPATFRFPPNTARPCTWP